MSKQPTLYGFANTDELAKGLRHYIGQAQSEGLKRHDAFKVAVSGGSLPATLAKALLAPSINSKDVVQWGKWEIFFADERAVPLDHEDSNYALLKSNLLDKLPSDGPVPTVHTIDTHHLDDLQEMADQYEQALVKSFAAKDTVKLPTFDLLLLGAGPDGHTCSLFPGHPLLRETDAWVAPISDSPKPPSKRITLTLPVVTHGIRIAFVTSGASKQDILKKIFDSDDGPGLPTGLVNQAGAEKVSWFCDAAAVKGVCFPVKSSL